METKNEKFNPVKYTTDYIKTHYKRKEIKLKQDEAEKVERVLKAKNMDLKKYTMENIERDIKLMESAKK